MVNADISIVFEGLFLHKDKEEGGESSSFILIIFIDLPFEKVSC